MHAWRSRRQGRLSKEGFAYSSNFVLARERMEHVEKTLGLLAVKAEGSTQ